MLNILPHLWPKNLPTSRPISIWYRLGNESFSVFYAKHSNFETDVKFMHWKFESENRQRENERKTRKLTGITYENILMKFYGFTEWKIFTFVWIFVGQDMGATVVTESFFFFFVLFFVELVIFHHLCCQFYRLYTQIMWFYRHIRYQNVCKYAWRAPDKRHNNEP